MSLPALLTTPDPRAVARTVGLPVAILGALLAHPMLLHVQAAIAETEQAPNGWGAVAVCAGLTSLLHLHLSMRGGSWVGVLVRCAGFGALLGPLNSGVTLATVVALRDGAEPGVIGAFVLGTVFGVLAGGAIGVAFGIAFSPLALASSRHRMRPTYAGPDQARALGGAMVLVAATVHHVVIGGPVLFQALCALAGAILLGGGMFRIARLHLFLRAVRRGSESRWTLASPRGPADVAGLVPIHGLGTSALVLYRATHDESASPYRSQEQWLPVARLAG